MMKKYNMTALALVMTAITMSPCFAADMPKSTETRTQTYSYDTNGDGYIEPGEFTTYVYTRADSDRDGFLNDEEWKMNTSQLYRPYKGTDTNTYTYWDQDKNGKLDSNEVKTLVEKTDLYSKWDENKDGKVDTNEFAKGTFNAYDDNADGSISMTEWKSVLK
jgi:Ca2+-binding EF-hand superfamily protein